jgi:hypothetical protein
VAAVLEVVLDDRGRFVRGRVLPTVQAGKGIAQKDPSGQAWQILRELTRADFPKTPLALSDDGTLSVANAAMR